jgi:LCP family protein required for cell wall assembly
VRRRWKVTIAVMAVFGAAVAAGGAYVRHEVSAVPRFPTRPPAITVSGTPVPAPALTVAPAEKGQPQTFLVFSVGSRGLTAEEGRALGLPGWRAQYEDGLTDVIMVVTVNPNTGRAGVLSIPRDTWIAKYHEKINGLYNRYGVETFKREVENLTSIPVNHLVSVNFTAFGDLTNEVGGVNVAVAKPTRDAESGLNVAAGCVHMDGRTALAWVRSRYTETQDAQGRWRRDPSASDWGRIDRQHTYLHALLRKLLSPRLVTEVPTLLRVAKQNLTFDEGLGVGDLITLARAFGDSGSGDVETFTYPTTGGWVGSASVVFAHPDQAQLILQRLRSGMVADPVPTSSVSVGPVVSAPPSERTVTDPNADPTSGDTRPDGVSPVTGSARSNCTP